MAGRHTVHAVVLFAGDSSRHRDLANPAACARRPEIHPDRPRVPDAALGRCRPRGRPAPSLPRTRSRSPSRRRLVHGLRPPRWRIAAQIVAAIASMALILADLRPHPHAVRSRGSPRWQSHLAVLLPRAAELGHDTLSDSLGLMCTFLALWARSALPCAVAMANRGGVRARRGAGYLARPEVALVPFAFGAGLARRRGSKAPPVRLVPLARPPRSDVLCVRRGRVLHPGQG